MPDHIRSKNNPEIKFVRSLKTKKKRKESRFFLVEGTRSVNEAIRSGQAVKVFLTDMVFTDNRSKFAHLEHSIVSEQVMESISATKSPPGIAALCRFIHDDFETLVNTGNKFAFLDNISDPGNLGTLVRTAHAAGLNALFVSDNCADIYNPKTIRATMGSIFYIPFTIDVQAAKLLKTAKALGLKLLGLQAGAGKSIYDTDISGPTVLLIGSEAAGLSETLTSEIKDFASIPMNTDVESLNAAIAGSIAMMEFKRRGL